MAQFIHDITPEKLIKLHFHLSIVRNSFLNIKNLKASFIMRFFPIFIYFIYSIGHNVAEKGSAPKKLFPNKDYTLQKNVTEKFLSRLLKMIVLEKFSDCFIAIVYESNFPYMFVVEEMIGLQNTKQVNICQFFYINIVLQLI